MTGIIAVDKPREFTSFDVVAVLRGKLRIKRIGHGGTLDPMATGVLPVFVGNAAKAISLIPDTGKRYTAGFELGVTSDTLDVWGTLSGKKEVCVTRSELEDVLSRFRGNTEQIPPMYSALKVDGKKLCDLARSGVIVERKPRPVTISGLSVMEFDGKSGVLDVSCSAGTYIRSLISDIGEALGVGAVMTSLVRTRSCGFSIEECTPLSELRQMSFEELKGSLFPVERVFSGLERIELDSVQNRLYLNGVRLDTSRLERMPKTNELCRVYYEGEFLGVARSNDSGELIPVKRFPDDGA